MTLVFEIFMSQTAGPEWTVGIARLNGFNGMQGMPSIGISLFGYNFEALDNKDYYVIFILAMLCVCKWHLNHRSSDILYLWLIQKILFD